LSLIEVTHKHPHELLVKVIWETSDVTGLVEVLVGWLVGNPSKIATGWSFFWLAIGWLQKILFNRLTTLTN
jgi:hypothetical protein